MTFEEFLEWADEDTHAEWVHGKVIFLSTSSRHQLLMLFLSRLVADWIEHIGDKGMVCTAPFLMRCQVGMPGREPDLLYVRDENRERIRTNYLEGAADLAIEIVRPESVRRDYMEKFAEYEAGGVGEYWIIDPATKVTEFYVRDTPSAAHFRRATLEDASTKSGGVYVCALLGGLRINTDWLFAADLPPLKRIRETWATPAP